MEEEKAKNLSKVLDLPINPEHMILSHTPMREIAETYGGGRELTPRALLLLMWGLLTV